MTAAPVAEPAIVAPTAPVAMTSAGQAVQASAALQQRAEDIVKLINGEESAALIFSPKVLEKMPAERLEAVAAAVRNKYGRAVAVDRIEATTAHRGRIFLTFEQTQLSVKLGVQPAAPNLIVELLFA